MSHGIQEKANQGKKPRSVAEIFSGVTLTLCLIAWYFFWAPSARVEPVRIKPAHSEAVAVAGHFLISVAPSGPLAEKLEQTTVQKGQISTPLLTVTGAVMASLRPGSSPVETRWQFSNIELSGIYADWQKAATQKEFAAKQLSKIRELTTAQINAQTKVVERMHRLVETGTEAVRNLNAAETQLIQIQLEGQKAIFEAESNLTQAMFGHADLERHLLQSGVDPALIGKMPGGTSLVMADVPEVRLHLVSAGQSCEAHFYSLPDHSFHCTVRSLSPTLSPERRTLRVFFELNDKAENLKPGMYAEIGLGTDPRTSVFVPADSVLHIGRDDFVLVDAGDGLWRITNIQVGEQSGSQVEISSGLKGGERIIAKGAILLKPIVLQAKLQAESS